MKKCTKCNIPKLESDFSFKNKEKNIRQSRCKSCQKEMDSNLYKNSSTRKIKIRNTSKKKYIESKEFIDRYKKLLKCTKCGDKRHYVLDFHHLADKRFSISIAASTGFSIASIKKEIRKCIVLCSNCHRELHYLEKEL